MFTINDVRNAYNLRVLIEGYACSLSAQNRCDNDIEQMKKCNNVYETAINNFKKNNDENLIINLLDADRKFHNTIITASKNDFIPTLITNIISIPLIYQSFNLYNIKDLSLSLHYHKRIVEAITQKDSDEARSLIESHIYHGRDHALHNIERIINSICK